METLKKYWWLFLLVPIAAYIVYVYYRAKKEVNDSAAKARAAKADYAALKREDKIENGTDNQNG